MRGLDFFVRRPRLTTALALVLLLPGFLVAPMVPISLFPSVARPAISVSCTYPGASAREVMNTVAGPLEDQMNGVEGMDRMSSSCYDSGAYSLTVNFQVGYDRDVALMKVQSKVQQAMSLLPQEIKNTGVTIASGSSEELGALTVRSPRGTLSHEQLLDYVYGVINPAILRVAGVGKSTIMDDKPAMRIWLDADRLAALGIDTTDVVAAIKAQNVQASLGSVGASPSPIDTARVIALIARGRLSSAEDFGEIIVRTETDGGLVRLKDIARIGMGKQAYTYSGMYGKDPAVVANVYQLPGSDVLATQRALKQQLEELKSVLPEDLECEMTYDVTLYLKAALGTVAWSVALAFGLLLLAVWGQTRSLRTALAVAGGALMPMSVTFAAMCATGFFLNLLTLYALLLALVLSVAFAAIVVIRVRARLADADEPLAAAAAAVRECLVPTVMAALAIAGAMIPIAMIDGVQGVLIRQFAAVLAPAALMAAFNALVVMPVVTVYWLGGGRPARAAAPRRPPLGKAALFIVCTALALAAYSLSRQLPSEFVPDEDLGLLYVNCMLAEGASVEATVQTVERIVDEITKFDAVDKVATILSDSLIGGKGDNRAKLYVVLKNWRERGRGNSDREVANRIRERLSAIPEARIHVFRPPPVTGFGGQGGIAVLVQSMMDSDPVNFAHEVQKLCAALGRSPLAESTNCGTTADSPHLRVNIDREKCELMQVPMSTLFTALQHYLGSVYVNDVNLGTQVNRVTVMSDWAGRATADGIRELYVRSKTGDMVPIDTLVTFEEELGVNACYRCNQYLYCTMQFITKPGVFSSEALDEIRRISAATLPRGYAQGWYGLIYEQFRSRGDTGLLMALALLVVYLALVARFESWRKAIVFFLPAIASVVGAELAHLASGVALSACSMFMLLILPIVTTALALLTKAADGWWQRAFLPLLFAVAVLPLVFASGAGAAGTQALGVSLLGGFLGAALLSGIREN